MSAQHSAYLALGSNLGDRRGYLNAALAALALLPTIELRAQSGFIETKPVGPGKQDYYLNAAVEIRTTLTAHDLLAALLTIEQELGRTREEKWGPRTIDLDILCYDDLILHDATLTIPHPHLHERTFVLAPLCEIAPELIHPAFQRTMRELLAHLLTHE